MYGGVGGMYGGVGGGCMGGDVGGGVGGEGAGGGCWDEGMSRARKYSIARSMTRPAPFC